MPLAATASCAVAEGEQAQSVCVSVSVCVGACVYVCYLGKQLQKFVALHAYSRLEVLIGKGLQLCTVEDGPAPVAIADSGLAETAVFATFHSAHTRLCGMTPEQKQRKKGLYLQLHTQK